MCYALLSVCLLFSAFYITHRKNSKFDSSGALLHRNQCCTRFFPITSIQIFILGQCWTFLIVVSSAGSCTMEQLPLEGWLEGLGLGGLCVSDTGWGSCSQGSPCSPPTHPSLPWQWGGAQGLHPATQAGLVHAAVKVHVLTLFALALIWGIA